MGFPFRLVGGHSIDDDVRRLSADCTPSVQYKVFLVIYADAA
jgi:hypothetical protein